MISGLSPRLFFIDIHGRLCETWHLIHGPDYFKINQFTCTLHLSGKRVSADDCWREIFTWAFSLTT